MMSVVPPPDCEAFLVQRQRGNQRSQSPIGTNYGLRCGSKDVIFSARITQRIPTMSDFKFACPVCGQHITCDSGSSGSQMDCPTCFRHLVVPQAPAPGKTNFVLTASEVQTRSIPLPGKTVAPTVVETKMFPIVAIVIGVLVCGAVLGAVAFYFHGKKTGSDAEQNDQTNNVVAPVAATNSQSIVTLPLPAADATNWTLTLDDAVIPDAPASGAVNGFGFNLERAGISEGKLDLRQGAKWPPDVGVSIHLFAKRIEDIAGRTVIIESTRTNAPKVILRWKNDQGNAVTKEFKSGYAARLEFGQVNGKWLPGKIFIAAPDDARSYVAGTFNAEIRKPSPPKKKP